MQLHYSFHNLIILLGGIQGIILTFVLLFTGKNLRYSNKFLALMVFIMGIVNLDLFSDDSNWIEINPLPFPIPNLYLGIGPALFFFIKCRIYPTFRLLKKDWLHFLPVIIECLYYLTLTLWITKSGVQFHFKYVEPFESYLSMMAFLVYIALSYRLIISPNSIQAKRQLRLLKWLVIAMIIVLILWFAHYLYWDYRFKVMGYTPSKSNLEEFFPVLLALGIIIYGLGFSEYFRGGQMDLSEKDNPSTRQEIPDEKMADHLSNLKISMEDDQLYLNPDLNLALLAEHLQVNPKTLSQILNSGLNKKFNDFVNEYRVEEVKKRLLDKRNNNLTIMGIAMDSGFNSKSAFNRIFKELTQLSPKEFKDKHTK